MLIQQSHHLHLILRQVTEPNQREKVNRTKPCIRSQKYFIFDVKGAF